MPDMPDATSGRSVAPRDWRQTRLAADYTHHVHNEEPLYTQRFHLVQKFHHPGLAPVRDASGAYHIDIRGLPAYPQRFSKTFGFYEERAAVEARDGWLHVMPSGHSLYASRFAWVGNYQEGLVPVRDASGRYSHLALDGKPAYTERHLYAGDFRDGIAVVRYNDDGRCGHIDREGRPTHAHRYLDLDVYHKRFARARDECGWCHVGLSGEPAYDTRLAAVEPFYNGTSLVETLDGRHILIDEAGVEVRTIRGPGSVAAQAEPKLLVVGNIGAGKSTLISSLARELSWRAVGIDDCRIACADGSPAGELRAWSAFTAIAAAPRSVVLECSGCGPQRTLLWHALQLSGSPTLILLLDASPGACLDRLRDRTWETPYVCLGVPMEQVIGDLDRQLQSFEEHMTKWGFPITRLDATQSAPAVADDARRHVTAWLREQAS